MLQEEEDKGGFSSGATAEGSHKQGHLGLPGSVLSVTSSSEAQGRWKRRVQRGSTEQRRCSMLLIQHNKQIRLANSTWLHIPYGLCPWQQGSWPAQHDRRCFHPPWKTASLQSLVQYTLWHKDTTNPATHCNGAGCVACELLLSAAMSVWQYTVCSRNIGTTMTTLAESRTDPAQDWAWAANPLSAHSWCRLSPLRCAEAGTDCGPSPLPLSAGAGSKAHPLPCLDL
eukprot:357733-Pelagomonas_calceolata.AAC.9